MKELSIEEKAKAYDEAVINGSRLWESDIITRENYEYMFPEIKESEDERIKKEIIRIVKIWTNSIPASNGIPVETLLAWLEKQGEQKPIIDGILTATNYDKMFQNCKVHKFNIGDYIKHNKANIICKIISVNDGSYYVENIRTNSRIELFNVEQNFHLWTIKDVKPGDVLVYENDIVIFKENNYNPKDKSGCMFVYCSCNNFYEIGGINPTYYKPATKEQCDLLFTKMKEAGYEWDSKKKELKKIHNALEECKIEYIEHGKYYYCIKDYYSGGCKRAAKGEVVQALKGMSMMALGVKANEYFIPVECIVDVSPVWDEEDEKHLDRILKELESQLKRPFKKPYLDNIESDYNWLKFLKERYTWKPSKEQLEALEHFVRSIGESGYTSPYDNNTKLLYSLLYDLKKLKVE